jgi:hypothetical protein
MTAQGWDRRPPIEDRTVSSVRDRPVSVILFGAHADTSTVDVPGKATFARLDENAPAASGVAACSV